MVLLLSIGQGYLLVHSLGCMHRISHHKFQSLSMDPGKTGQHTLADLDASAIIQHQRQQSNESASQRDR